MMNMYGMKFGIVIRDAMPKAPHMGPPVPSKLNVNWPVTVNQKMPGVVRKVGNEYNNLLYKLTSF